MTTFITISVDSRELISQAVNETIIYFRNNSLREELQEEESLCLYYAGLTADLCTNILYDLNNNSSFFYRMNCGKFSICTNLNSSNSNQAVNFGATGTSLNQGKYHCWVVGLYDQTGYVIHPSEFIDLTSRFYPINAQKQRWTWNRNDIGDYLWLQDSESELEKLRISAFADQQASEEAYKKWSDFDADQKILKFSMKKYDDLQKLARK